MKVEFRITADLDAEVIAIEGIRRGFSRERSLESVIADLECRLSDSIRWRDAVTRVGVSIAEPVLSAGRC